MRRRSKTGGGLVKARSPKRPAPKRRAAVKPRRGRSSAAASKETEVARLKRKLREAQEQQTATARVLSVISSSPAELDPVFQSMLENATRICEANFGTIYRYDGELFHTVASRGEPPALVEFRRRRDAFVPTPGQPLDRMLRTRAVVRSADDTSEPVRSPAAQLGGARSHIAVPMFKDDELVGAITLCRREVRPFTDKQIELVQNFASQAVIAIENTRLLNELRESLERQTATSEVLRVISTSAGQLEPVFETMLENAVRICGAKFGNLLLYEGGSYRFVATHGAPPAYMEFVRREGPFRVDSRLGLGRLIETKQSYQVADAAAESTHGDKLRQATIELAGARTILGVPLLKDGEVIGSIIIYRQDVRPFNDKQIALVQNFAAQAVIAIGNTRLLSELRESLDRQTAMSEVLGVIASSGGELKPVFQSMLASAMRICEADCGFIYRIEAGAMRTMAELGVPPALAEYRRHHAHTGGATTPVDVMRATKKPAHVHDARDSEAYRTGNSNAVAGVDLGGARTVLYVPMLKGDEIAGVINVYRKVVRPFSDAQIALLENFAAQAVIAIENARLLNELRQRTRDLSASLEDLRTAQDRLVQTEKLASLGQLTAGIAHEIKNPLNFVNNFSSVSVELIDELQKALTSVKADDRTRADITELTDTLRGNLGKIVQHGKRADSIVKNMLLHSREGSGEHRPVDINAVVEESLNLAYHGARAEKEGFNITLARSFDPTAGEVDLFPQEITRVLLNLISNGFYAATKRKGHANNDGYEPTLTAATKNLGDRVEIRIRDNGTGIPPEVKDKMFNPFFTTKPAGEGTGLGLSISHDIVVKQHAGSIAVDTELGQFTEFRIVLPRKAAAIAKSGGNT